MYYKSVHYTKINGKIYIPGEEINAEIPEEDLQRLLEIGAIKETAPGIRKAAAEPAQAEPELEPEETVLLPPELLPDEVLPELEEDDVPVLPPFPEGAALFPCPDDTVEEVPELEADEESDAAAGASEEGEEAAF